jgi:hypothetical protein
MHKIFSIMLCISLLAISSTALAKDQYYKIRKDVKVLAFIGDPASRHCKPIRYTIAFDQKIRLLHKRSGPGVYAFYIENLIVKSEYGVQAIKEEGYFLARTRHIKKIK